MVATATTIVTDMMIIAVSKAEIVVIMMIANVEDIIMVAVEAVVDIITDNKIEVTPVSEETGILMIIAIREDLIMTEEIEEEIRTFFTKKQVFLKIILSFQWPLV